jgi:hypothetical protein
MSSALLAQEGKVTELMSNDLTNLPGKEGLMITVEYPVWSKNSNELKWRGFHESRRWSQTNFHNPGPRTIQPSNRVFVKGGDWEWIGRVCSPT